MYLTEIKFHITNEYDQEGQENLIETLHSDWYMNGQIIGGQYQYAKTKDSYKMYQLIHQKDSLSKYNNNQTKDHLTKLQNVGLSQPIVTMIDNTAQENDLCYCKKTTAYLLYTTFKTLGSALRCKQCFKAIPLYKIPKLDNFSNNYYPLIIWQSDYQSCDSLQINCSVGERFAMRQLGSINSQLTKDGLDICKKIEKLTGIQTYYYLYKFTARSKKQELLRKCPQCGGEWLLEKPLHDQFDFECKKCGLLSTIAWDVR